MGGRGNDDKCRNLVSQASAFLEPIHPEWIPDDLRALQDGQREPPNLLESTIVLSQEILGSWDFRELARRILATINHLSGAERGALFTTGDSSADHELDLKASLVLTKDDMEARNFADAGPSFGGLPQLGQRNSSTFPMSASNKTGILTCGSGSGRASASPYRSVDN